MGRLTDELMNSVPWENTEERAEWWRNKCYEVFEELEHYRYLEEQGRLIELPCAVGDTVYLIEESYEDALLPSTLYYYIEKKPFDVWMLCGVGKTVFLTEEEAEAKLKELEGDKE